MGVDNHLVTLGHRPIAFVTARFSATTQALDAGRRETSAALSLAAPDNLRFGAPLYGPAGWADAYDGEVAAASGPRPYSPP